MSAACCFCKAAAGTAPVHEVYRNGDVMAFLDVSAIRPGHTLIIPIAHHDYFDDLPGDTAAAILHLGQCIARAQKRIYGVARVGFLFSGGDMPHAHAHVVPIHDKTDLTSARYIIEKNLTFRALPPVDPAILAKEADRLTTALRASQKND